MHVFVVSNRLPVSLKRTEKGWEAHPSSGGLVSALAGVREKMEFSWIGWPGASVMAQEQGEVRQLLERSHGCIPVHLDASQIEHFYDGFCNSVLWPLLHYLPGRVDFDLPYWDEYKRVNEQFAEVVLASCKEDSVIWIHDYHLFLLPQLLRAAKPKLRIGFFLHIPFPASEIYRLLPVRKEILRGVLGSDLIGFHTHEYGRYFAASCLRILGAETTPTEVRAEGRRISYGAYPIGIDPGSFSATLAREDLGEKRRELASKYEGMRLILGVDRIDYIKGLPLKLKAFKRFLEQYPEWRGKVVLLQVAIPSRLSVKEYQQIKNEVDLIVGQINGQFGNAHYSPIQYVAHDVEFSELCLLYERADALLITSVRDGMNLVALEYAACQRERHGVLLLSEFTGASRSMGGAVFINPWDAKQTSEALHQALTMEEAERASRALQNYSYVKAFHSVGWARRFLKDLTEGPADTIEASTDLLDELPILRREFATSSRRLLLLDYDGTLVPFVSRPEAAAPPSELIELLKRLAQNDRNVLCLISGRTAEDLDRWFGNVGISMAAEHGLFVRFPRSTEWKERLHLPVDWMPGVEKVLQDQVRRVPGSFIERKKSSLAWHYRMAEEQYGEWQALELALHLDQALSNLPVSVVQGHKVVEVRPQGVDKGRLAEEILEKQGSESSLILCMGDDRTDEDMFRALPPWAWTCRVGSASDTRARYFLQNSDEVRVVLEQLASIK